MAAKTKEEKQDKGELLKRLEENFTETEKVILSRRSTRWYKKEQVPEFMVKRMLEAARFAPSAGNCQPWKFIVVRDPKIIDDITRDVVKLCKLAKALNDYRTPGKRWKLPIAKLNIRLQPKKLHPVPFGAVCLMADGKLRLYHGAQTVILIFKDVRGVTNPDLDCGIAGQNLVLAAHSMGLGTCWVSLASIAFDYLGFKWNKFFGIRYPYKFITSVAVGWPMGKSDGFVERPTHTVDWYENGAKSALDPSKGDSRISFGEKFSIPDYSDPLQTHQGEMVFDHDKCNGCASCERICPASAIVVMDKKAVMPEGAECMACGDCMAICPQEAIRMKSSYVFSEHFKTIDHGDLKLPRLK